MADIVHPAYTPKPAEVSPLQTEILNDLPYAYYPLDDAYEAKSLSEVRPDSISGLVSWLNPDDLTGNDGDAVTSVPAVGTNPAWTALNGGPFLRRNGLNGRSYVEVHGQPDYRGLVCDINLTGASTVFVVGRLRGVDGVPSDAGRLLSGYRNNWLLGWHGSQEDRAYFEGWIYGEASAGDGVAGPAATTNLRTYAGVFTAAGGNDGIVYRNGVKVCERPEATAGPNGFALAGYQAATAGNNDEWSDTDVYEVIAYNRALTAAEMDTVHEWLRLRHGTVTNSPMVNLNVRDASGNGRTAVVTGAVLKGTPALLRQGFASKFKPTERGVIQAPFSTIWPEFTVEVLVHPEGAASAGEIISKRSYYATAATDFPFAVDHNADGTVSVILDAGDDFTANVVLTSTGTFARDKTHHVVVVVRNVGATPSGLCELYVNGGQEASATIGFALPSGTRNWTLGATAFEYEGGVGGLRFDGRLQHWAIYDKALPATRIQDHYNASRYAPTPVPEQPQIAFRSYALGTPSGDSNSVVIPADVVDNDALVAHMSFEDTAPTSLILPAGWRPVATTEQALASTTFRSVLAVKRGQVTDGGSTATFSAQDIRKSTDPTFDRVYADEVLIDGPVGYWRLGEASGTTAADSSGNSLTGTYTGSYTLGRTGALAGDANTAFQPRASSSAAAGYVNIGNPAALQITGDQTIEMWLRRLEFSHRENPWNKAYAGEGTVTSEPNGAINYYYGTDGTDGATYQGFTTAGTPLADSNWHHVVLVRDLSSRMYLCWYIDGVLLNETPANYAAAKAGTQPAWIGDGYVESFVGHIDEVAVYNKALSAERILAHYNKGMNAPGAGAAVVSNVEVGVGVYSGVDLHEPVAIRERITVAGTTASVAASPADGEVGLPILTVASPGAATYTVSPATARTTAPSRTALYEGYDGTIPYRTTILGDNPISYWRLNEASGDAVDQVGGHNGTVNGGITRGVTGLVSGDDKAMTFDGAAGTRVQPPVSVPALDITSGTVEAWFRTANAGTGHRGIAMRHFYYGMFLFDNKLTIYDWGAGANRDSGVNCADGVLHHAVCTFQSGVVDGTKVYLDGALIMTTSITVDTVNSGSFVIGAGNPSGSIQNFTGTIDEVAVYSTLLTADQVLAHYNAGKDQPVSSTVSGMALVKALLKRRRNIIEGFWQ